MDVSTMLIIIITGLIGAGLIAAFINGIVITTNGSTVTGPDGKDRDENAMIFYPVYKLICAKKKEPQVIYYSGRQLEKLLGRIHKAFPPLSDSNYTINPEHILFQDTELIQAWWHPLILNWLDTNEVHAQYYEHKIMFSAHYPRYILPAIIRKPIVQCVRCMASFWGSLAWWGVVLPIFGWGPTWQLPGWIVFCFVTAYLSTFLYKKANP